MMTPKQKIIPNLWFDRQAEESATFYVSVFQRSRVGSVTRYTKAACSFGQVLSIEQVLGRFTGLYH